MGIKNTAVLAFAAASSVSAGVINTRTSPSTFTLKTRVIGDGEPVFNGLNVTWGHTGAGMAALLGSSTGNATPFYLEDSMVKSNIGGQTYSWGLEPTEIYPESNAPCNYYPIDFDEDGFSTSGFTIAEQDVLSYTGTAIPFNSFVACEVQGVPDLAKQVIEIMYSNKTAPAGCSPPATEENQCALIQLIVS